jgi:cysteinyl-tRNA synthetase
LSNKTVTAYVSNSSVYFDTIKFHKEHSNAKFKPDHAGVLATSSKDKSALTTAENTSKEKRNKCDFVLWKKGKPGETTWHSKWGRVRPGLHVLCGTITYIGFGKI